MEDIFDSEFVYLCLSMTLQSFVGPWPLFQFLNSVHSRLDSLDGGPARRKAAIYTPNNTNRINAQNIYALSGVRTHDSRGRATENSSCLRPRGHCGRHICVYNAQLLK
jgi:hypothetical protein